jgi:Neutral/alkaline non-lysosomal ceramidase, N-terminal
MSKLVHCSLGVLTCVLMGAAPAGSIPQDRSAQPSTLQAHPGWSAGVARVVVTPTEPIFMKGYGSRTKPSEGVRQDLLVKALALRDETGATSVLVTSDLHSYTRRMSDTIAEAAQKKYGLARSRLILNGSHTHSGPAVTAEPWLRPAEDINAEQEAVIRRYTARLLDRIVDLIGRAIGDLAPADVAFAQGSAAIGSNRRRLRDGTRQLPGVVDQDVPVLSVRAPGGTLRAVVFGYACHATAAPADYQIGGDWPGYAQAALETEFAGATAMFVNGCSADCDPAPRSTVEAPKMHGDVLALAVSQVVRRQMRPVSGPLATAFDDVEIPFQKPPTREELESVLKTATGMRARHAKLLLGVLDREGKIYDRYPYPVQVWRFGSGLTLIALGGEMVVDYSLRFKGEYGWDTTWVAGYSNDVMGYIASHRILEEGGYEGGGAMVNYGRPGPLGDTVEEVIAGKVGELVARVGGKPIEKRDSGGKH